MSWSPGSRVEFGAPIGNATKEHGGELMPDPTLEPQMRVRRIDDVLDTDIDDQTVMMDIEQGRYFGLNDTGTRIWDLTGRAYGHWRIVRSAYGSVRRAPGAV